MYHEGDSLRFHRNQESIFIMKMIVEVRIIYILLKCLD